MIHNVNVGVHAFGQIPTGHQDFSLLPVRHLNVLDAQVFEYGSVALCGYWEFCADGFEHPTANGFTDGIGIGNDSADGGHGYSGT